MNRTWLMRTCLLPIACRAAPRSPFVPHTVRRLTMSTSNHTRIPFKQAEESREPFDVEFTWNMRQIVNPDWQVPQGANKHPRAVDFDPKAKVTQLKPEDLDAGTNYKLLINGVVPRPIAFVSSQGKNGVRNLAPFSYFAVVGHNPPIISVSINAKGPSTEKDTATNILETKRFVVNIISEPFIEAANYTSIDAPADVSEWTLSGLTPVPNITWGGDQGGPPRVGESAYSLECELYQSVDIKNDENHKTATLILGRIRHYIIKESFLNEDKSIDPGKLLPVSRLGGITYAKLGSGFEAPRPKWEEEKEKDNVKTALQKAKQ
ncbi:hypothetical protein K437DRAFT_254362 [Tilletiaria anomala UBC 951]|uniref:Flavin reductase like domain-containing protein n=1 Tax=Tilletiaria anomala (strain ATCC 24038 / CBS 436.72 / UBC 951) TaxID=1037660 RepID=A0A066WN27_TILAU|nr:uncharacterized protein K437DRAFT_254362 [Tilletiaria anomala UBC 951]KDN52374.1 hypothetical protein K437DRAFT_254362 [Tilletiaria anomala UBC 951]